MLVMRPAQAADLSQVQRLAADGPVGVTSLPDDAGRLHDKILTSEVSFAVEVNYSGEEGYFFVPEDNANDELIGCSAIAASVRFSEPFYSFRNETFMYTSRSLSTHNRIHVLLLCHDPTGNSLLTSLYVQHDLVQSVYTELNSRGRLLFVASHPERFADAVMVKIIGYGDEQGESPFWNAIGRSFSDLNYIEAEKLFGLENRTFLAELMPHYPIYVPLLPDAAQESIGQVHPQAQITFDIPIHKGFEADNYIGIFGGGPTLHAHTSGVRSIAQNRVVPMKIGEAPKSGRPYLVTNGQSQDFRMVVLGLDWTPGKPVTLGVEAAEALDIGEGASVRLIAV